MTEEEVATALVAVARKEVEKVAIEREIDKASAVEFVIGYWLDEFMDQIGHRIQCLCWPEDNE